MRPRKAPTTLHGEAGAATLYSSAIAGKQPAHGPVQLRNYRYVEKGVERIASFPIDSSYDVAGSVKSASSGALADYQDKLKAIAMREKGLEKSEVASRLERSERWVQRWWRENPKLLQRPAGANDLVMQRASLESFRDLEISRDFVREGNPEFEATSGELLRVAVEQTNWKQAKVLKRNADTGELENAYDRNGATINAGRQVSDYRGGVSCLDRLLQKIFAKTDIRDPQARIFMNYYADGQCRTGVHRHDFWTCLVSIGAERILTVDNRPILLRNGDMITFGTQTHGVPVMPDVTEGRISLVIFFYPDHDNLERRQWKTITDDGGEGQEADDTNLVEVTRSASLNQKDSAIRRGCDTSLNMSILWGETEGGTANSSQSALDQALDVDTKHSRLFESPNASQWHEVLAKVTEVPVDIFTIGVGHVSERDFFEKLASVDVSQLWDLRSPDAARDCPRYAQSTDFKQCCSARHISLRTVSLGRHDISIEQHLASEEGQHTLRKIVSAAQCKKTLAIVGYQEDWRSDARRAIADLLIGGTFGAVIVKHLLANRIELHERQPTPQENKIEPANIRNDNSATVRRRIQTEGFETSSFGSEPRRESVIPQDANVTSIAPASETCEETQEPARRTNRWNRSARTH